jgi:hypothetical protein
MSELNNGHFSLSKNAALVVGHPGHELKVHGWLEAVRPIVFVLTDGSGRSNQSRLGSTSEILDRVKAQAGDIYGGFSDRAAYAAILNHEFDLFIDLAAKLSQRFVSERIDFVAGDAIEGYNPMHDVCRLVINAAVKAAMHASSQKIVNVAFSLVEQPHADFDSPEPNDVWLKLDDEALQRKITAAQGYRELAGEVSDALERAAVNAFRVERLRAADAEPCYVAEKPPFYETYGEEQVAAGHYERVLRYSEHIAPLAEALAAWSGRTRRRREQREYDLLLGNKAAAF